MTFHFVVSHPGSAENVPTRHCTENVGCFFVMHEIIKFILSWHCLHAHLPRPPRPPPLVVPPTLLMNKIEPQYNNNKIMVKHFSTFVKVILYFTFFKGQHDSTIKRYPPTVYMCLTVHNKEIPSCRVHLSPCPLYKIAYSMHMSPCLQEILQQGTHVPLSPALFEGCNRLWSFLFSSVQFKMVLMRSGRPICAPPRPSGVSQCCP